MCIVQCWVCSICSVQCALYTDSVQCLGGQSPVIKFGISSAGRSAPDQQSNPYKSQSGPFSGANTSFAFLTTQPYHHYLLFWGSQVSSQSKHNRTSSELLECSFPTASAVFSSCSDHKGRAASPKRMNFWKSSKRGGEGGVISNPKIYVADFGP